MDLKCWSTWGLPGFQACLAVLLVPAYIPCRSRARLRPMPGCAVGAGSAAGPPQLAQAGEGSHAPVTSWAAFPTGKLRSKQHMRMPLEMHSRSPRGVVETSGGGACKV